MDWQNGLMSAKEWQRTAPGNLAQTITVSLTPLLDTQSPRPGKSLKLQKQTSQQEPETNNSNCVTVFSLLDYASSTILAEGPAPKASGKHLHGHFWCAHTAVCSCHADPLYVGFASCSAFRPFSKVDRNSLMPRQHIAERCGHQAQQLQQASPTPVSGPLASSRRRCDWLHWAHTGVRRESCS